MKKKKDTLIQIKVTDLEGNQVTLGKYDESKRVFMTQQAKSIDFYDKLKAWGIDSKVLDFLVQHNASIIIKDTETKWEYKCEAGDLKLFGTLETFKTKRSKVYLPLEKWEIIRANNKSFVLQCQETSCLHNFGKNCLRGTISIDNEGQCSNYEDKIV